MREISYEASELVHPGSLHGRDLWTSNGVENIVHKLHYGDPTLGWEGDPRLALYHDNGSWVLERLEADGRYRVVCRSKKGLPLDERLIMRLVEHDHQRGFDASLLPEERPDDPALMERTQEALERVYYAAGKGIV